MGRGGGAERPLNGIILVSGKFLKPAWSPPEEIRRDKPNLPDVIPGGTPGDRATAWSVVHAAPLVKGSEPGLITVLDLPAGR